MVRCNIGSILYNYLLVLKKKKKKGIHPSVRELIQILKKNIQNVLVKPTGVSYIKYIKIHTEQKQTTRNVHVDAQKSVPLDADLV